MIQTILINNSPLSLDDAFTRAFQLFQANRLEEAEKIYQQILQASPENPRALHALGSVAYRHGNINQAIALIRQALALKPDYADACNNLGNIYKDCGEPEQAFECYQRALAINGNHPLAHNNLGVLLLDRRKPQDALRCFDRALAIIPEYAEAHLHRGNALTDLGQLDEALACYAKATGLKPGYALAHFNWGNALKKMGCMSGATEQYEKALAILPDYTDARMNMGNVQMSQGLLAEALDQCRKVLESNPENYEVHSNLLFCLNYLPDITAEEIFRESLRWAENHEATRTAFIKEHLNNRDPDRRLRIGYVSPDFRKHSVSYFCLPLFAAHDRNAVELFCYGNVSRPDLVTARIEQLADCWIDTTSMTDLELAQLIRRDHIDILVDLAGHTAKNRLTVFAEKPAPVQITWLGYPGTTGMSMIDYRLTDDIADPPGEPRHHSEELLRLPDGFLCYQPPADAPPVSDLPLLKNGYITFGSFNNPAKITPQVLHLWSSILAAIPDSRLILKSHCFSDAATRARFQGIVAERGIVPERLELLPAEETTRGHLTQYSRIDISLDPFPYNGTTTTCESLWMGVPVLTMAGSRHAGRVGASILSHVGFKDLIAYSGHEYIENARRLADDPHSLQRLRNSVRATMSESALCDGAGFARHVEAAYREVWKRWCGKTSSASAVS